LTIPRSLARVQAQALLPSLRVKIGLTEAGLYAV